MAKHNKKTTSHALPTAAMSPSCEEHRPQQQQPDWEQKETLLVAVLDHKEGVQEDFNFRRREGKGGWKVVSFALDEWVKDVGVLGGHDGDKNRESRNKEESNNRDYHDQEDNGDGPSPPMARTMAMGNGISLRLPLLKPASEMTRGEKAKLWWQKRDFERIQEDNLRLATKLRQSFTATEEEDGDNHHDISFTTIYLKVFYSIYSSTETKADSEEEEEEKKEAKLRRDIERLAHWTRAAPSLRGLEKVSIPEVSRIRKARVKARTQAVLDTQSYVRDMYHQNSPQHHRLRRQQRQQHEEEGSSTRSSSRARDTTDAALRMASEYFSRSDQRFAQLVGRIDAKAVRVDLTTATTNNSNNSNNSDSISISNCNCSQ